MNPRLPTLFCWLLVAHAMHAQFAPPAGQPGTTAIAADSSIFVAWADGCTLVRGPQDIGEPSLGLATVGDESAAIGAAGGNGVVSLGDGGSATLTFMDPITNGPGWDFAVFENSFSDTYLELAFVEVSSDGQWFVRFPASSLTSTSAQVGPFGELDATRINNLAGKYRALFGTPFDLEELAGTPGLDVDAVTHVRIVDAVGSLLEGFAMYDHEGRSVNDPWPTPFPSSGFDLDAVGVIHARSATAVNDHAQDRPMLGLFPNPASSHCAVQFTLLHEEHVRICVTQALGREQLVLGEGRFAAGTHLMPFDVGALPSGLHVVHFHTGRARWAAPLIVQ